MRNILNLIKATCSNYFDNMCLLYGKKCHATKERCVYLEDFVIPGVDRKTNPDLYKYKKGIKQYKKEVMNRKT